MRILVKAGLLGMAFILAALSARADEIRLKDGKKLYGVIVAYEDGMFKVKTDFGYVLVEKDKIAAIIPSTPAESKKEAEPAKNHTPNSEPVAQPASAPGAVSAKTQGTASHDNSATKVTNASVHPATPEAHNVTAAAPDIKTSPNAAANASANSAPLAPPAAPEPPPNREEVQGNTYTNYTHGFRMFKAPGWDLIEGARNALPNAIVAMGTPDESTLLVIGEDPTKAPLSKAAPAVEQRLSEIYDNYRLLSQQKTTIAGMPAMQYKYSGNAGDHDWSGTLVVIERANDTLTVLGMTYAQTDLIQIQENVIARVISSLDFNVH
jgi:hypothetical protein